MQPGSISAAFRVLTHSVIGRASTRQYNRVLLTGAHSLGLASMSMRDRAHRAVLSWTPLQNRRVRKRLVHARRRLFEFAGSPRFSMPGFEGIDVKLQRYLPPTGTFLEAGANDGYTWSNTYYLERFKGWSGVLVEGIPALSEECRRLRSGSIVHNCALVEHGYPEETVTMTYSDLRSLIAGSEPDMERRALEEAGTYQVRVPARTLDDVLGESGVEQLDFVSLDLEGFEAPALRGLDLDRYRPQWLLVEIHGGGGRQAVEHALGERYEAVEDLTSGDVLYRRRAD
jgi:FkbM family methyltransferase